MLNATLLALAPCGALNMHGSLLPKYRGRVPINWAIIHGETETGATLHYMTEKPDRGDIVAQSRGADPPRRYRQGCLRQGDGRRRRLPRSHLPALIAGTAPRIPQDLSRGSYFSGRKAEDGIIDWSRDATSIHNLVRAVAPPYPGARTTVEGRQARILRTHVLDADDAPRRLRSSSRTVPSSRSAAGAVRYPCCNWKSMVQRSTPTSSSADSGLRRCAWVP